jgi:hypothetical protein
MNKKLKTFAIAILVTGATVTATRAPATDTNTFTNVIQDLTISLTVYSNAPIKSSTSQTGEKAVTLTTKSIIAALSNASATIPSLVGFDWGKSPQLVIDTTFTATNVPVYSTNEVATNTAELSTTNANVLTFGSTTLTVNSTTGSAMITNKTVGTNGGTNVLSVTGWTDNASSISTTNFTYTGTNGTATDASVGPGIPTNVGVWTVITAATNSTGQTNVTALTYTNYVSGHETNYMTNGGYAVEVQGGTATAPTFADVSSYVSDPAYYSVIITATGTGLGTTNQVIATESDNAWGSFGVHVFNTSASTAPGNNLDLSVYGFSKEMFKNDVLLKSRTKGTNQVGESTFTASVSGYGNIGGSFETNGAGTNSYTVPATEYYGTNTNPTNAVSGFITNPIPVVVEGTISLGAPKSVPQ